MRPGPPGPVPAARRVRQTPYEAASRGTLEAQRWPAPCATGPEISSLTAPECGWQGVLIM